MSKPSLRMSVGSNRLFERASAEQAMTIAARSRGAQRRANGLR